ncbi:MAG: carbohydrate ABC transporter permease [Halanaerobiaceae bacterium]
MSKKKNKTGLSLKQKEGIMGYIFNLPFIIGFIFLFLYPFVQSIIFSLSKLNFGREGYSLEFIGLQNFRYSLFVNTDFVPAFFNTLTRMVTDVPIILVFSFFAAFLLNQKFRGRFAFRLIFFLPVIYGAGIILKLEQGDAMMGILQSVGDVSRADVGGVGAAAAEELTLSVAFVEELLMNLQLPRRFTGYIIYAIEHISELIRASGIQILIFLAGLQSIPDSLFEASRVEGANSWENFWLITLPLMSPLILTNIIYSVIDFFTAVNRNELMEFIDEIVFSGSGYGVGTAMSWLYLISVFIILGLLFLIVSRFVYYQE